MGHLACFRSSCGAWEGTVLKARECFPCNQGEYVLVVMFRNRLSRKGIKYSQHSFYYKKKFFFVVIIGVLWQRWCVHLLLAVPVLFILLLEQGKGFDNQQYCLGARSPHYRYREAWRKLYVAPLSISGWCVLTSTVRLPYPGGACFFFLIGYHFRAYYEY